jgi:hypothetical protein
MAAEQPSIMKGQNRRYLGTQPGKSPQVKIAPVQVVAVDNIRFLRSHQLKKPPGARVMEILLALI